MSNYQRPTRKLILNSIIAQFSVSPGVALALKQADIIIYSAGTQHSSLYPTYMAGGLASIIADNGSAQKYLLQILVPITKLQVIRLLTICMVHIAI